MDQFVNSVGLIIAKRDSKRLPNKNFRDFCGKPMFLWNLRKMLKIFNKVYVSSDYDFILEESEKMGAIPIKRPKNLCGDVPSVTVFQHALNFMDNPDIVISVQANSPTMKESLIKTAKELMENYSFNELATLLPDLKPYYSVWAIRASRLKNYGNPYNRNPEIFLIDDSVDIHTKKDFEEAKKQLKKF